MSYPHAFPGSWCTVPLTIRRYQCRAKNDSFSFSHPNVDCFFARTKRRSRLLPVRCSARLAALPFVQRTKLCKKTLNPYWGEEFKFEVADDSALQNEPIEFKVWGGVGWGGAVRL